ncbi:MAG: hypothetical protein MZV70_34205 [Desulfobacterales bacterium]|nr:hypothetical protein [Desulfobacterales bacterium]
MQATGRSKASCSMQSAIGCRSRADRMRRAHIRRMTMGEFRKNFGRDQKIIDIPNLIDIQTRFLREVSAEGRRSGEARELRPAGGFQERLSHQRFQREVLSRVRAATRSARPSTTSRSASARA